MGEIEPEKLLSGVIGAMIERKSLEEGLESVGVNSKDFFDQLVASGSSDVSREYTKERIIKQMVNASPNEEFYLIKKVLCDFEDYGNVGLLVSGEDTDKFKVLRIIGSNREAIGYKQENPGLETYLVSGKNSLEAMRKTDDSSPLFYLATSSFDLESVQLFDKMTTKAFYEHTPESFSKLFEFIRGIFL